MSTSHVPAVASAAGSATLQEHLQRAAWALPAFGVLLVLGTLTHQPDPSADFAAYARYVTTAAFLVSHLVASIAGAAVGIVGTVSVAALVALRTPHPRRVLWGAAASIAGHVFNTALYGVAAFAQPAIGRAYQDGVTASVALDSDVYGPELGATAAVSLLFWTAGAVLVGSGLRRSSPDLRVPGLAYAVALPVFFVSGLPGGPVQPVVGVLFTVTAVVIVLRLRRAAVRRSADPAVATAS